MQTAQKSIYSWKVVNIKKKKKIPNPLLRFSQKCLNYCILQSFWIRSHYVSYLKPSLNGHETYIYRQLLFSSSAFQSKYLLLEALYSSLYKNETHRRLGQYLCFSPFVCFSTTHTHCLLQTVQILNNLDHCWFPSTIPAYHYASTQKDLLPLLLPSKHLPICTSTKQIKLARHWNTQLVK